MVLQQSEFWLAGVQGMVAQHSIACASAIAGVKQSIEYRSKNAPKMSSGIGLALCISLNMLRRKRPAVKGYFYGDRAHAQVVTQPTLEPPWPSPLMSRNRRGSAPLLR